MKSRHTGYTLIELLLYIAFFTLLAVLVVQVLLTMTKSFVEIRAMRDLTHSGSVAMERILHEVRDADTVVSAETVFDTNPGTLTVQSVENSVTKKVEFVVSSGDLQLYENSVLTGVLNGDSVTVTSFIVRNIPTPVSTGVKIELTLQDTRSKILHTETFYSAALLRGSY